jgi:hypothetical protein
MSAARKIRRTTTSGNIAVADRNQIQPSKCSTHQKCCSQCTRQTWHCQRSFRQCEHRPNPGRIDNRSSHRPDPKYCSKRFSCVSSSDTCCCCCWPYYFSQIQSSVSLLVQSSLNRYIEDKHQRFFVSFVLRLMQDWDSNFSNFKNASLIISSFSCLHVSTRCWMICCPLFKGT